MNPSFWLSYLGKFRKFLWISRVNGIIYTYNISFDVLLFACKSLVLSWKKHIASWNYRRNNTYSWTPIITGEYFLYVCNWNDTLARAGIRADGDNAGLFESQVCFMQLQIAPRREFQCELRLIMRLASHTSRDFHTCELERCTLVMKMLIKPFVKSLRMSLPTFETYVSPRLLLPLLFRPQIYMRNHWKRNVYLLSFAVISIITP